MSDGFQFPVLIGDIGGTNARFSLLENEGDNGSAVRKVRVADHETIEGAIEAVGYAGADASPATVILAVAGPINDEGIDFTNSHWRVRGDAFVAAGPWNDLLLVNDFEAQAFALPMLGDSDLKSLGGNAPLRDAQTKAVLGPGTGLGVGTLVRAGAHWVPVPGEGGHVDLGPRTERERAIWDHLGTAEGRVSGEEVLTGDGMESLYSAIQQANGEAPSGLDAASISRAALAGTDPVAVETLEIFCTCLGRSAGDLALTVAAKGGVYVAGGIILQILDFALKSDIRTAFDDKAPHGALMRNTALVAVTHPQPALLGLAAFARDPDSYLMDRNRRRWRGRWWATGAAASM